MASLAFVFPLRAGKTQEWRDWAEEVLGPRRSEYEAFSRRVGLRTQRAHLRTSQDPFVVWVRQRTHEYRVSVIRPGYAQHPRVGSSLPSP
jgi:hypothetical protein